MVLTISLQSDTSERQRRLIDRAHIVTRVSHLRFSLKPRLLVQPALLLLRRRLFRGGGVAAFLSALSVALLVAVLAPAFLALRQRCTKNNNENTMALLQNYSYYNTTAAVTEV